MKRPENIIVGNRTYKVIIDPALQLREGLQGSCDHQKLVISLLPRLFPHQVDECLWHEVLHAVNAVYLNSKLSEEEIHNLGQGLSQVILNMRISFEWEEQAILKGISG